MQKRNRTNHTTTMDNFWWNYAKHLAETIGSNDSVGRNKSVARVFEALLKKHAIENGVDIPEGL